jgi:3-hydroxyisobutyrate dehydrogenase-like beta-hydroxyacid dehydrogenase
MVGLGLMGSAIAERLLDAGVPLLVYNRTPAKAQPLVERGGTVLESASGALRHADVCVSMVADDEALEAVMLGEDGVLEGGRPGTSLIEMSTVSVEVSRRVAARAAEAGVTYLRAPVSGNPTVVRGGTLTIVVSGPSDAASELDGLLHAIGPTVFYVGEDERARVVKLALQVLVGGTVELLSESLVLGESAGVDRAKLLEVIGSSAVGSPLVGYKTEPLLRDDYSATFTTAMMLKDIDLVLALAADNGAPMPFTKQLRTLLESAAEGGYADQDFMALYPRLREAAGSPLPTRSR